MILAVLCSVVVTEAGPPIEEAGAVSPLEYKVGRTHTEVIVDGSLDEQAWVDALSLELQYEVQPGENIPPPVRTELLVTYDDQNVYFGFRAYDPEPSKIRARYSDRDEAWSDDWVGVVLDTFNDQRRAYELLCNPLGVQMDAINDDVLNNYNDSWNAIWDSRSRITDKGYEVEMAVPFNQIRFQNARGEPQTWGFDAIRSYPRSDRHHIGLFPRDRGKNSYLSQTVKLVGMEGVSAGRNLELLPTLIGSRLDERTSVPAGEIEKGNVDADLGATVRWGITPNVSLNGALNPDFSQVEADVLRLDINEQFTLFFPETRPFFLEGSDYFSTPMNLVHTRVTVDPIVAGKVTGKHDRHTYGVFSAQDEITTVVFPGPEGSSSGNFDQETTNSVGRYRFDFGSNSTVGATVTDRHGGEYFNQVASLDTTLRFTEADQVTASYSASNTRYSEGMIADSGVRDDTFSDDLLHLKYEHSVRGGWTTLEHSRFGEGFRADLGFIPQVGFNDWRVSGAKIWWGEEDDFHRRFAWGGAVRHMEHQNGELLNESFETWVNMNGPKQSYMAINLTAQNRVFDDVQFEDMLSAHTWFEIQATDNLNLVFHQDYGDGIDFANTRSGTRTLIQPRVKYNLGRHLILEYNHTYSALDVEGGQLFRAHAPEGRFVYQFNTRSFIRAILQYTDIKRDASLYNDVVEPRSKDLSTQLLFAYKVNPQTAIYIGYSDHHAGTEQFGLTQTSRSLFVKLAYAWVR